MKSELPKQQSYEDRISRVRLWTVIPAVFLPLVAWYTLELHVEVSKPASELVGNLLVWSSALGWWLLKAAPRPFSVRASLGRAPDLAGWGVGAWALFGSISVRIIWWIAWYCRDILQVASSSGAYTFRLPRSHLSGAFAIVSVAVLAPLIEELLFRGTLFRSYRVRFSPGKAALLSSVLFGLIHSDSMAVFIAALTSALAYTRTRSLWAPIVLHAINNGGWVVLSLGYFGDFSEVRLAGPRQFGAAALVLLIGLGVWLQFMRKYWRTLGDPLPPDSLRAALAASPSGLPEALRAGG
ncbi:MAG: type II CAAX endopeptidase family protein [Deltaproteobacteria bacterium]